MSIDSDSALQFAVYVLGLFLAVQAFAGGTAGIVQILKKAGVVKPGYAGRWSAGLAFVFTLLPAIATLLGVLPEVERVADMLAGQLPDIVGVALLFGGALAYLVPSAKSSYERWRDALTPSEPDDVQ